MERYTGHPLRYGQVQDIYGIEGVAACYGHLAKTNSSIAQAAAKMLFGAEERCHAYVALRGVTGNFIRRPNHICWSSILRLPPFSWLVRSTNMDAQLNCLLPGQRLVYRSQLWTEVSKDQTLTPATWQSSEHENMHRSMDTASTHRPQNT